MDFNLKEYIASCKRKDPLIAKDVLSWKQEQRTKIPSVEFGNYIVLERNDKYFTEVLDK